MDTIKALTKLSRNINNVDVKVDSLSIETRTLEELSAKMEESISQDLDKITSEMNALGLRTSTLEGKIHDSYSRDVLLTRQLSEVITRIDDMENDYVNSRDENTLDKIVTTMDVLTKEQLLLDHIIMLEKKVEMLSEENKRLRDFKKEFERIANESKKVMIRKVTGN